MLSPVTPFAYFKIHYTILVTIYLLQLIKLFTTSFNNNITKFNYKYDSVNFHKL